MSPIVWYSSCARCSHASQVLHRWVRWNSCFCWRLKKRLTIIFPLCAAEKSSALSWIRLASLNSSSSSENVKSVVLLNALYPSITLSFLFLQQGQHGIPIICTFCMKIQPVMSSSNGRDFYIPAARAACLFFIQQSSKEILFFSDIYAAAAQVRI